MVQKVGAYHMKFFKTVAVLCLIGFAAVSGYTLAHWVVTQEPPAFINTVVEKQLPSKNVLVLGTDESRLRSDVMMLGCLNTTTNTVDIISIPRDTRVKLKGDYHKINNALTFGGGELACQTVQELTGIQVDTYVLIDFDAFGKIIDILGGVDFDVPQDMYYADPTQDLKINLKKGQQHLDGDKAEQLVRFRQYKRGDEDRISVQRDFIQALFEQKLGAGIILKLPQIIGEVFDSVDTNMSMSDMISYAGVASKLNTESLSTYQLPGAPKTIDGLSYYIADTEEVAALVEQVKNRAVAQPSPTE